MTMVSLPAGSTLEKTDNVLNQIRQYFSTAEKDDVYKGHDGIWLLICRSRSCWYGIH